MTDRGGPRPSAFGHQLRRWRRLRGASQLRLATEAGVSTRHLSFVETGRSQPSRDMVLRLADALDVPLRERNALLAAAGFASLYRETALGAPEMEPVGRVLAFLLASHEPFPAYLVDRCGNVVRANAAGGRGFARFTGPGAVWRETPVNLLRLTLHPDGLRPWIVNWADVANRLVTRLQREIAFAGRERERAALLDELLALPGVAEAARTPDPRALDLVLPLHLKRGELELRLFSCITTIGTPQDVTLEDVRIESLLPADAVSEAALRQLAAE
jgi:transcriptional regulator with XRE-family HTH domain